MPTHDIIDNRTEKLVDHLNQILGSSERGRFAVGYLFLSGLTRMIEEKRLKVRVFTKGRLHAKAYIWDYGVI